MNSMATYFDELYKQSDDPWKLRKGWYERRKRALTLAMLPRERYRNAFEPGCANGELTVELASRCDTLLAADLHERAVLLTRERLARPAHASLADHTANGTVTGATAPQVRVEQRWVPADWPTEVEPFDLILISEFAYYLDAPDLEALAVRIAASLTTDATLLACHWRRPFSEARHSAEAAHEILDARCGLARVAHHKESGLLIDVWSRDPLSIAQREGLE
ncbi:SAM-dependent methyltransferase [Paraburkholderia dilworthii]|uniref:SAM-dependent methyltransferase n=1 Tax=Paraburkholderia dilworthii TaxID=948106 RepID=UPI0004089534|nr:SAM-dependent methyltransferase [Paraburkholderia dilworthii]